MRSIIWYHQKALCNIYKSITQADTAPKSKFILGYNSNKIVPLCFPQKNHWQWKKICEWGGGFCVLIILCIVNKRQQKKIYIYKCKTRYSTYWVYRLSVRFQKSRGEIDLFYFHKLKCSYIVFSEFCFPTMTELITGWKMKVLLNVQHDIFHPCTAYMENDDSLNELSYFDLVMLL